MLLGDFLFLITVNVVSFIINSFLGIPLQFIQSSLGF